MRSFDIITFDCYGTLIDWEAGIIKPLVGAGFDRKNRELYSFETLVSSAPGERYQIERRHEKLAEYYAYFRETGRIKGDK